MHAYFYKNKIIPKNIKWRKKLIPNIPLLENMFLYLNIIMSFKYDVCICVLEFLRTGKDQKSPIMIGKLSICSCN